MSANRTAAESYSIGDAAELTGVSASTLRAWESRYGLLAPARTGASYRTYTRNDIELIRRMRLLVDSGMPARRAAAVAVDTETPSATAVPEPRPRAIDRARSVLTDHDALITAARHYDPIAIRELLDEAFAVAAVDRVIDDWLMPTMQRLGEAWESDEVDVAVEHFLTAAVMRRLAAVFEATPAYGPRVVVGLPAGCRHELPALGFAVCLRRAGIDVVYLGSDVPADSWQAVITATDARAAVISAGYREDIPAANEAAGAIRGTGLKTVYAGGHAAGQLAHVIPLPDRLAIAATLVATALSRA